MQGGDEAIPTHWTIQHSRDKENASLELRPDGSGHLTRDNRCVSGSWRVEKRTKKGEEQRVLHFHARKGEMLPKNDDNKEPLMKYIYVQRDGRDALVSFYHHLSAAVPEDGGYAGNWSDFFDDYTKGALPYSRWTDHLVSWSVSQDDKAVLFLRYEDMLSPEGLRHAIREIASHVGCELVHEEDIESIARETTFAAMKSKLSQYHPESVAWREEKNFSFIRKGTTGSHRELFSDAQQEKWRELMIDANANASNATLLEHYNYTISTTSPSP